MTQQHGEYRPDPTYDAPYSAAPYNSAPYPYGPPVSAAPQTPGSALQPYAPAAPPVPYGQPYPQQYAQPYAQLVSAGGRFGALLLDGLLILVTLWIGWAIWTLITWSDGQTPAKKILGHVVINADTGQTFGWGEMALREFCVKGLLGYVLNIVSFGIYSWVDAFMVFGDRQRTLHDRISNSLVRHS
jgi:uncharacterized RDD family membrane protein YckC